MTSAFCHAKIVQDADVVELADTYDLGSYVERHAGSSPVIRTKQKGVAKLLPFVWSKRWQDLNRSKCSADERCARRLDGAQQLFSPSAKMQIKSCHPHHIGCS